MLDYAAMRYAFCLFSTLFFSSLLNSQQYGATALGVATSDLKTLQEKQNQEPYKEENSANVPRKIRVSKDNPFYKDDNKQFAPNPNVFDRDPQ